MKPTQTNVSQSVFLELLDSQVLKIFQENLTCLYKQSHDITGVGFYFKLFTITMRQKWGKVGKEFLKASENKVKEQQGISLLDLLHTFPFLVNLVYFLVIKYLWSLP